MPPLFNLIHKMPSPSPNGSYQIFNAPPRKKPPQKMSDVLHKTDVLLSYDHMCLSEKITRYVWVYGMITPWLVQSFLRVSHYYINVLLLLWANSHGGTHKVQGTLRFCK